MMNIKRMFRTNYVGEDIVVNRTYSNQAWVDETDYIPNVITNTHVSTQALVIGNGITRKEFNLNVIANHHGGLLGERKLQTYGCNALYRDYHPDFLVSVGKEITQEIANSHYTHDHIVYTNADEILNHPSKFYLIPQNPSYNAGSLATYLAAFDGFTRIYLLGFDGQDTEGYNYNMYAGTNGYQAERDVQTSQALWVKAMKTIFDLYPEVDFCRVMPTEVAVIPEEWKFCPNFRQVDFRGFVLDADV